MSESAIIELPANTKTSFRVGEMGIVISGTAYWQHNIDMFLDSLREQPTTQETYRRCLSVFMSFLKNNNAVNNNIGRGDLRNYRTYLQSRINGHTAATQQDGLLELATANLYLAAVRSLFKFLAEEEIISKDYASGLKNFTVEHPDFVKMHLTENEARELINYYHTRPIISNVNNPNANEAHYRDIAIIELMLHNGLRAVEISRAKIGGIKEEYGGYVLYIRGKGRLTTSDFVVLSNKVYGIIRHYLSVRGPVSDNEPLFTTTGKGRRGEEMSTRRIQGIVKEGLNAIGLTDRAYSPHSLRHTTAVQLLKHKVSLYDIQMVMRHRDPKITERYLLSTQKEERIHNAAEAVLDSVF